MLTAPPGAPNLAALVGHEVAHQLLSKAGGLGVLSSMSHAAVRHVGLDDMVGPVQTSETSPSSAAAHRRRATLCRQLHCGYLVGAPLFVEHFGTTVESDAGGELDPSELVAARKAVAVLSRKCAIVIKVDAAGSSSDGSVGAAEREKLHAQFETLLVEGKVTETDLRALPVPQIFTRRSASADEGKRRGGRKIWKRREAQKEVPTAVERAVSRVRLGVSEEEQMEAVMQRPDIRASLFQEAVKRPREASPPASDEYGDLSSLRL